MKHMRQIIKLVVVQIQHCTFSIDKKTQQNPKQNQKTNQRQKNKEKQRNQNKEAPQIINT